MNFLIKDPDGDVYDQREGEDALACAQEFVRAKQEADFEALYPTYDYDNNLPWACKFTIKGHEWTVVEDYNEVAMISYSMVKNDSK